jgi:hypothetical protein
MSDVRRQLIVYERSGRILKWHDRKIPPGAEWRSQIDKRLKTADVVLLFMSPHFIESRYCHEIEGRAASQRHVAGQTRVVPIVLRPCPWEATPFGALQALPVDAKPITRWDDRDEACLNAARGVMRVVDELSRSGTAPPQTSVLSTVTDAGVVYCGRCGRSAGHPDMCTGSYTHHEFRRGSDRDYCKRCGAHPGIKSICTGSYTHHEFSNKNARAVFCSRCGAATGSPTTCTGSYTHHEFVGM